ncbi:head maturation protease [Gordonia phage Daredevil]|uniref:MuF-like minor capsid protein n=1 Tax=Gordonia phage Daredevil TaxID=2283286 RepID=A0A345MIM1_9CAUD|nr:head maturation protease [Gordonia phage Daredevil]AXH70402.1 MuF-like minor capsid protein [Gordonia phage Daredevil]
MAADTFRSLIDVYASRRTARIERSKSHLEMLWRQVDPYDGSAVSDFAEQAAMISAASQQHVALMASTKQTSALELLGAGDLDFAPNVPDEVRLYNPDQTSDHVRPIRKRTNAGYSERIPLEEVFDRPARKYRYLRSVGKSHTEALEVSVERVKIAIETNVMLAEREAENQVFTEASKRKRVTGWRRILHPEKSEGGACGLCIAAADRIYTVKELKALHARCKCDTLPIYKGNDPGLDLNAQDLESLYSAAGSTAGADLKKLRFLVEQHGELGPVLVSPKGVTIPFYSAAEPQIDTLAA